MSFSNFLRILLYFSFNLSSFGDVALGDAALGDAALGDAFFVITFTLPTFFTVFLLGGDFDLLLVFEGFVIHQQ